MKKLVFALLLLVSISSISYAETEGKKPQKKKSILMIIAPVNFRDEELFVPEKMFKAKGMKVTIASTTTTPVSGMLKGRVTPDITLNDVYVSKYDAIVFVGGIGAQIYYDNKKAWKIAKEAVEQHKVLAAICLAPNILAKAGLLDNKKATCWNSDIFLIHDVKYVRKKVVVDGNIITANGPKAARKFAEAIIKALDKK